MTTLKTAARETIVQCARRSNFHKIQSNRKWILSPNGAKSFFAYFYERKLYEDKLTAVRLVSH